MNIEIVINQLIEVFGNNFFDNDISKIYFKIVKHCLENDKIYKNDKDYINSITETNFMKMNKNLNNNIMLKQLFNEGTCKIIREVCLSLR